MICNYSNAIAMNYGINAALIAGYINYRLKTKSAVAVGDKSWVRITQKSLTATFPFMGEKAVRNAIRKLKKANILSVKQLGKDRFDHGYFYTLTEQLKAVDMMRWIGLMNNIRSCVDEIVLNDIVYS